MMQNAKEKRAEEETKMGSNEEIYMLIAKERQCRIRHLHEELVSCYYSDATVTTSWTSGNVSLYLNGGNAPVDDPEYPIVSRIALPVVHRNGRRAYVEVPSTTMRWVSLNGEKAILEYYMRLIYRVEMRDEDWKISDFRSIYEGDTLKPEVPGTDLHIDPIDLVGLRHPYRYMAYVDGEDVSQDLPGIDRPEEINKLYEELENWLYA